MPLSLGMLPPLRTHDQSCTLRMLEGSNAFHMGQGLYGVGRQANAQSVFIGGFGKHHFEVHPMEILDALAVKASSGYPHKNMRVGSRAQAQRR